MRTPDEKLRPHLSFGSSPLLSCSLVVGAALALALGAGGVSSAEARPRSPIVADASPHEEARARELLAIDERVSERELLAAAARAGVEVLFIDAERDGVAQIAAVMEGRAFTAVHLIAHGRPGEVQIGSTRLDARHAADRRGSLARWFAPAARLGRAPELLIYACDVSYGPAGAALMRTLAAATGAEVAASNDRTGGADAGGDWDLEASTGPIEASLPIAASAARAYPATLEIFTVTNGATSGPGSLAQAVADANANANPGEIDYIRFDPAPGTIAVDSTLSVVEPLTILGPGPGPDELVIVGASGARLFEATSDLSIQRLTLANGSAPGGGSGGAILVEGGSLVLGHCVLTGNTATGSGGAVAVFSANLAISDTALEGNAASLGGALYASNSTVDIIGSRFEQNAASAEGGAIAIDASTAFIDDSLFAENEASGAGGAIHADHADGGPPLLSIQNSTISGNTAVVGGGLSAAGSSYAEFVHVTVAENTITGEPGGCSAAGVDACDLSGAGLVLVESSILAGNLEGTAAGIDLGGDALDLELEVRSSLIGILEGGVATSGEPIFGEDPLLGPLADNGGATRTHALLAGSPAIDLGENPGAAAYDQRGLGFPRVIGAAADMGAYEWSPDDGAGQDGGVGSVVPKGPGGSDGCGCSVPGAGASAFPRSGGIAAALVGLLGFVRRRRAPR